MLTDSGNTPFDTKASLSQSIRCFPALLTEICLTVYKVSPTRCIRHPIRDPVRPIVYAQNLSGIPFCIDLYGRFDQLLQKSDSLGETFHFVAIGRPHIVRGPLLSFNKRSERRDEECVGTRPHFEILRVAMKVVDAPNC